MQNLLVVAAGLGITLPHPSNARSATCALSAMCPASRTGRGGCRTAPGAGPRPAACASAGSVARVDRLRGRLARPAAGWAQVERQAFDGAVPPWMNRAWVADGGRRRSRAQLGSGQRGGSGTGIRRPPLVATPTARAGAEQSCAHVAPGRVDLTPRSLWSGPVVRRGRAHPRRHRLPSRKNAFGRTHADAASVANTGAPRCSERPSRAVTAGMAGARMRAPGEVVQPWGRRCRSRPRDWPVRRPVRTVTRGVGGGGPPRRKGWGRVHGDEVAREGQSQAPDREHPPDRAPSQPAPDPVGDRVDADHRGRGHHRRAGHRLVLTRHGSAARAAPSPRRRSQLRGWQRRCTPRQPLAATAHGGPRARRHRAAR